MKRGWWRAWGASFLAACIPAAIAALAETWGFGRKPAPTVLDLLYGANVHLLCGLILSVLVRIAAWRAGARMLLWLTVGAVLLFELAIVVPYWLNQWQRFPPLRSAGGKGATLGVMALGALLAAAVTLLGLRRARGSGQSVPSQSPTRTGIAGLLLAAVLIAGNAITVLSAAPRMAPVATRADAQALRRPHVFILMIDTLRRDHVSFFGYERPTSPNLDRLLSESIVFTDALTPSIWTIPSVASLFTGLHPSSHGVVGEQRCVLPQSAFTLAEYFREWGYRTGAFVSNPIVARQNGFAQGFETYFPDWPPWWFQNRRTFVERLWNRLRGGGSLDAWINDADARLGPALADWIDRDPDRPLLAYVHFISPHDPYRPPPAHREAVAPGAPPGPHIAPDFKDYSSGERCGDWECLVDAPALDDDELQGMVANYDGEIHYMDAQLGSLLRELSDRGLLEDAHLLLFSDHGEEFWDHRGWAHGNSIYQEVAAGVMAYRPPGGLPAPVRVDRPVELIDLVRSLLELLRFEPPPGHQGRIVPAVVAQSGSERDLPALCECPPHLYALRLRNWKLIRRGPVDAPQWRLFDVERDPREMTDLAEGMPDTLAALRSRLADLVAVLEQAAAADAGEAPNRETLRRLRALGYIQ